MAKVTRIFYSVCMALQLCNKRVSGSRSGNALGYSGLLLAMILCHLQYSRIKTLKCFWLSYLHECDSIVQRMLAHQIALLKVHECDSKNMPPNRCFESPLRSFFFSIFLQKTCLATFLPLLPQTYNQGILQRQVCRIKPL